MSAVVLLAAWSALACASSRPAPATPSGSSVREAPAVAATVLADERFEVPRPIPALAQYEVLTDELLERLEQGGRWHLILDNQSDAEAEIAGGAAVLRITRAGLHWYSVQLAYLPIRLRPDKAYRVTFQAVADRPIVATFDLAHVGAGWHSYTGKREIEIEQAPKQYEVSFVTGSRDAEERARFEFNFGDEGRAVVRFDDVRVIEEERRGP
jgi:hypothetical protein